MVINATFPFPDLVVVMGGPGPEASLPLDDLVALHRFPMLDDEDFLDLHEDQVVVCISP